MEYTPVRQRVNVHMNYNGIGTRMRVARLLSGKNVMQIAKEVGINDCTIYRYELGTIAFPNPPRIFACADALNVSPYWMLSGLGKPCEDEARAEAIRLMLDEVETKVEPLVMQK